ncbi:MAG: acyl carrier protein [Alphaproteobacteria bacterium]|nr:acyl carrier protein [Alphaproteobacteria bacterium]
MKREEVLHEVQLAIQEHLSRDICGKQIVADMPSQDDILAHIGMDSFDVLSVAVNLEQKFDVRADDEEWLTTLTVNDLVDVVMSKL